MWRVRILAYGILATLKRFGGLSSEANCWCEDCRLIHVQLFETKEPTSHSWLKTFTALLGCVSESGSCSRHFPISRLGVVSLVEQQLQRTLVLTSFIYFTYLCMLHFYTKKLECIVFHFYFSLKAKVSIVISVRLNHDLQHPHLILSESDGCGMCVHADSCMACW